MIPATARLAPSVPPATSAPASAQDQLRLNGQRHGRREACRTRPEHEHPAGTPRTKETYKSRIGDLTESTRQDHEQSHPTASLGRRVSRVKAKSCRFPKATQ